MNWNDVWFYRRLSALHIGRKFWHEGCQAMLWGNEVSNETGGEGAVVCFNCQTGTPFSQDIHGAKIVQRIV